MSQNKFTVYTPKKLYRLQRVEAGIAYSVDGEIVPERYLSPHQHRVLSHDQVFNTTAEPTITHEEYLDSRSRALEVIKQDPILWAEFKKNNLSKL